MHESDYAAAGAGARRCVAASVDDRRWRRRDCADRGVGAGAGAGTGADGGAVRPTAFLAERSA